MLGFPDLVGLAVGVPLGDLAGLVVDHQEQIEVADGGAAAGALDHRLLPFLVVRPLGGLDRRPDVDAGALALEAEQEMLAHEFRIGAPLGDDMLGIFQRLRAVPAGRRLEFDEFQDHGASPCCGCAEALRVMGRNASVAGEHHWDAELGFIDQIILIASDNQYGRNISQLAFSLSFPSAPHAFPEVSFPQAQ